MNEISISSKVTNWFNALLGWATGRPIQPAPVPVPVLVRRPDAARIGRRRS